MSTAGEVLPPVPEEPVPKKEIFGWAMFDFANSSYTTIIVTVAFSIYFTKLVAPGENADSLWGLAITISNLIVVACSPILGAVADDSGRKKLFLGATYLACILGTLGLYWVLPGQIALALVLFILSNAAYAFGENLAGAFLPEISTPQNIGKISGFGWGLGYLGGLGSLLLIKPLLTEGFTVENLDNLRLVWPATAGFFLVSGLFTFALLRERAPRGPRRSLRAYAVVGFTRLNESAHSLGHFAELGRFLAIFFVFSCGLMSVIAFSSIFAERNLGFTTGELIGLFMLLQISSALGASGFGWIQDRVGAKRTIQATLVLWIGVSVAASVCQSKGMFWGIGLFAGLGIGSLQSASRGLVGLFSPVTKSGEFFGFWGLASKLAYATGPFLFGLVSSATGSQRIAILINGLFFVIGLVGMQWVDEARGHRAAASWRDPGHPTAGPG